MYDERGFHSLSDIQRISKMDDIDIIWYYDIMIWIMIYIHTGYIHMFSSIFINFHPYLMIWSLPTRQHGSTAASAASAPARAIAPNLCSSSRVPRLGACGSELPARIQPVEPTMPTDLRTQRSQRRNFKNVTSLIHSDILHYFAYFWMIRNDMFNGKTFRVMSTLFTPPL